MGNKTKNTIYLIAGVLLLCSIWKFGNIFLPTRVPAITDVLENIYSNFADIYWPNVSVTAKTALLALLISILIAFIIVICIVIFPPLELLLSPSLVLIKATPVVAFIPIVVSLYGTKTETRVILAILVCIFPIIMAGLEGIKRVPKKMIVLAKLYKTGKISTFIHFYSGYIIDSMLASIKVAAPLSLIGTMVGEFLVGGEKYGLGCFLASNVSPLGLIPRYATIIFSSLVGLIFYFTASLLQIQYAKYSNIHK